MYKFPAPYIVVRFISFWHCTGTDEFCPVWQPTSPRSILTLPFHLHLDLPCGIVFLFSSDVFDAVILHPSVFNLIIWWRIQIRKFLNTKLLPFFSHALLGPNILILSQTRIECNWKCWMMRSRLWLGYGTRSGVRIPTEAKDFFPKCPERLWRPSGLLLSGSWWRPWREVRPFTSILCLE